MFLKEFVHGHKEQLVSLLNGPIQRNLLHCQYIFGIARVCIPHNENDPQPGNGNMVAISAGTKEMADKLYHKAIELGGSCEGEPGQRMPDMFYGGYVRDPDGNKLVFYVFG